METIKKMVAPDDAAHASPAGDDRSAGSAEPLPRDISAEPAQKILLGASTAEPAEILSLGASSADLRAPLAFGQNPPYTTEELRKAVELAGDPRWTVKESARNFPPGPLVSPYTISNSPFGQSMREAPLEDGVSACQVLPDGALPREGAELHVGDPHWTAKYDFPTLSIECGPNVFASVDPGSPWAEVRRPFAPGPDDELVGDGHWTGKPAPDPSPRLPRDISEEPASDLDVAIQAIAASQGKQPEELILETDRRIEERMKYPVVTYPGRGLGRLCGCGRAIYEFATHGQFATPASEMLVGRDGCCGCHRLPANCTCPPTNDFGSHDPVEFQIPDKASDDRLMSYMQPSVEHFARSLEASLLSLLNFPAGAPAAELHTPLDPRTLGAALAEHCFALVWPPLPSLPIDRSGWKKEFPGLQPDIPAERPSLVGEPLTPAELEALVQTHLLKGEALTAVEVARLAQPRPCPSPGMDQSVTGIPGRRFQGETVRVNAYEPRMDLSAAVSLAVQEYWKRAENPSFERDRSASEIAADEIAARTPWPPICRCGHEKMFHEYMTDDQVFGQRPQGLGHCDSPLYGDAPCECLMYVPAERTLSEVLAAKRVADERLAAELTAGFLKREFTAEANNRLEANKVWLDGVDTQLKAERDMEREAAFREYRREAEQRSAEQDTAQWRAADDRMWRELDSQTDSEHNYAGLHPVLHAITNAGVQTVYRRVLRIRWSCQRRHEHRWRWVAWLCIHLRGPAPAHAPGSAGEDSAGNNRWYCDRAHPHSSRWLARLCNKFFTK